MNFRGEYLKLMTGAVPRMIRRLGAQADLPGFKK
jgi:hypothetical protein